jgi:hypothetical protein
VGLIAGKRFFDRAAEKKGIVAAPVVTPAGSVLPRRGLDSLEDFSALKVYSHTGGGGEALSLTFRFEGRNPARYTVHYDRHANGGRGRFIWERSGQGYSEMIPLTRKALISLRQNLRAELSGRKSDDPFEETRIIRAMLQFAREQT